MKGIPEYLKPFSDEIKIGKSSTTFSLKCACGSVDFAVSQNILSQSEKKIAEEYKASCPRTGLHSIHGGIGKDGKPYTYIKRFGFIRHYITFPDRPYFLDIEVVKAYCASCSKEITIFDNRYHGYDSLDAQQEILSYTPLFSKSNTSVCKVEIKLIQEDDVDLGPELFSDISIYRIINGKKSLYFSQDTM